jgi:phosphonate degradation associated HDIG domain protein
MNAHPIDRIFARYAEFGSEPYGELVSQRDHMLQCAHLAALDQAPPALVAAALLHDYGHLIADTGEAAERDGVDARHEHRGAAELGEWFGLAVVQPIALHVAAKRYLCAVEPGYLEALSPASALSLRLQGGPFTPEQVRAFAALPAAEAAIRLRRWDDIGKRLDWATPPLEAYRGLLAGLMAEHAAGLSGSSPPPAAPR